MKKTALVITAFMLVALSFGCGGLGSDPSFSPDPTVGDTGSDEEQPGGGGVDEVEVGDDDEAERDCFIDGFCERSCDSASDCPAGFSCVMHVCTFDCQSDEECGTGGVCNDQGLCEASSGTPMPGCTADDECGDGRFCNANAECEQVAVLLGCQKDADCPLGQYCDDMHQCEIFPGAGVDCANDEDCPGNYYCDATNWCVQECRTDWQCPDGEACAPDGSCAVPGAPAKLVSFTFNALGADTDPTGPVVFESSSYKIDMVEIVPTGRDEVLTSTRFRLVGSTGF